MQLVPQLLATFMCLDLVYWEHPFFSSLWRTKASTTCRDADWHPLYADLGMLPAEDACIICYICDASHQEGALVLMEILPGFALFRGLYELSQYALTGYYQGTKGMQWANLKDPQNGMKQVFTIMLVEWIILMPVGYYKDTTSFRNQGFWLKFLKEIQTFFTRSSVKILDSHVNDEVQKRDVLQEKLLVKEILSTNASAYPIVCDDLRKVYPGKDGTTDKHAVQGISFAVPLGQCFGMLGPNGAGKTSSLNMMIGLSNPTSGTAYIQGLDIKKDMDKIHLVVGVCPQYDLLWETLTGREHLLFYGKLKNLKGSMLADAVLQSLRSVNLLSGHVANKLVGTYSGGMKRRLSVAISLIGDPKVVYMDEPSAGLDPASKSFLWNVVKRAKQGRSIILTTHSMQEAEMLCDRVGIFVKGKLQCIGNAKELKSRYAGSYIFTISTPQNQEREVLNMVQQLSPTAKRIYSLSGTQKFELSKTDVTIADVFRTVEKAKAYMNVQAWGFSDTTLEDVFIKVAHQVM